MPTSPFTPGNIVVYRVGTGGAALSSAATAVFLDEYTPSGTFVRSVALPTADAGTVHALTASGTASSEGQLNLSADGRYLLLTGYDAAPSTTGPNNTSISASTSATTPRVVGIVDSSGTIDTSTTTTAFSANNPRAVTSATGTSLYEVGGNTGIVFEADGASGAGTVVSTTSTSIRDIEDIGGNLYYSTGSVTRGIYQITGLPTATGATATNIVPTGSTSSPYAFFFADLSASVAGNDTLYVADDTTGGGQIQKYSLVGSSWVATGTIAEPAVRGLTGVVSGNSVTLYGTTGGSTGTGGGSIYAVTDVSGYNATATGTVATIATAAANTAFRGVAFAPQSATPNETVSVDPSTTSVTHAEGDAGATTAFTYTLTRTGSTAAAATIAYAATAASGTTTLDGTDFTAGALPSGSTTFAAGSSTATITINVAGDRALEPNEGFTLSLSTPSAGYVVSSAAGTASGTITNDDSSFAIANGSANEGAAGGIPLVVTRSGDTSGAATLAYAVSLGANDTATADDFTGGTLPSGTVTFATGATSATINVAVVNDTVAEPDETFTVTLSGAGANQSITTAAATGTIVNDDAATAAIAFQATTVSHNEGDTGATAYTYTLTRTGSTAAATTVNYAVAANGALNAVDFAGGVLPTGTATFAAGSATATITVNVAGDRVIENDETFTVALSNPGTGYAISGTAGSATGTIVNDDGTIIPGGTQTTAYAANAAGNYALLDGVTRTQTAAGGVAVTATSGAVNIDIQGTLTDTATGQVAINYANNPIAGLIQVEAAGVVQSLNANAIVDASVNGTINLTNLGQILATASPFTPSVSGTNPGTEFAVTYNVAKGAAGAGATDFTSGGTITNGSSTNTAALIRSDNGDAVRLGSHETLVNWGTINADGPVNDASTNNVLATNGHTSVATTYDIARGIRLNQSGETAVDIENHGTIVGSQHGLDMGQTNITNVVVNNFAGATILGHNGSGVGGDTIVASAGNVVVNNSGTIRGEYAPQYDRAGYQTVDGDGDGVDIDGAATITNNAGGVIQGGGTATNPAATGAGGFDSNGRANASEGLSLGGGIVANYGTITGANAAIVVNNDANTDGSRTGFAATTITNYATGSIVGEASYAIRLENKTAAIDNDTLLNYGAITGNAAIPTGTVAIEGGAADPSTVGTLDGTTYTAANAGSARFIQGDGAAIQTGEGTDTLSNYGAITGNVSGRAINLEGGDDTLTLHTGGTVTGRIDGGAGNDTLVLALDDRAATGVAATTGNNSGVTAGTIANVVNVETLDVKGGTWTVGDAQTYSAGITIENGATLVLGTGAALTGAIADNGHLTSIATGAVTLANAVSGSGVVEQAGTGALTLGNAANSYSGGTLLTAGTLDVAAVGAAGTGPIAFATGAQTLQIESAALAGGNFAPAIAGFAADGDTIDVRGIGLATTSYDAGAGVLTLTGTSNASLHIGTGYAGYVFTAADDGAGGTAIRIALPALSIDNPSVIEGDNGTTTLTYTVTSSAPAPAGGISVAYATANGTATAGSDYVAASGTATIAAGATSTTIGVMVNGDTTYERNETVIVNLSTPTNATIATAQGAGTITNDDPLPTNYAYFSTGFDGFTAAGFAPTPGAGQLSSNIWRVVGLSDNTNPAYGFTGPAAGDFGRGLISTNDPSTAGVYSPTANNALVLQPTGAELDTNGFIEARLQNTSGANATAFDVAFDWAYRNSAARIEDMQLAYSTDGVNFTTVPAGAFSTPSTADATLASSFTEVHRDVAITNLIVPDQNYLYLRWIHVDSTGTGSRDEVGIDNVAVTATLSNAPALTISNPSVVEGNAGQTPLTFTLTRTSGTGAASVHYATSDGTASAAHDYVATSGDVTFADGETSKTVTVLVNGDTAHETDETLFLNLSNPVGFQLPTARATGTITNDDTGNVAIYDIQGPSHTSPFAGQTVSTSGVVTQLTTTGFFIQDPTGDGDVKTSDAVFVFTSSAPTGIAVGNVVNVTGAVAEYVAHVDDLSTTEINIGTAGSYAATGVNGTITPVLISFDGDGRAPPTDQISSPNFTVYDPSKYAIDFYESLEGMLVTFKNPLAVSNTDQYHDTYITPSMGVGATDLNSRGGLSITATDFAPEKIELYEAGTPINTHTQGDILNNVTGILQYYDPFAAGQGGEYELVPTTAVTTQTDVAQLPRETTALVGDASHVSYASFNIENFSPRDQDQENGMTAAQKVAGVANEIVNALKDPDIIGLQEMQDNDGEGTGSDLTATTNAQRLIDAIKAAGGPTYTYVEVAPTTAGSTGGAPGGNIRNGYLYNADRVGLVDGSVRLLTDPAFNGSRRPLLADFTFNGKTFTAVDVHSYSRGGSDSLFGSDQPATQSGDATRTSEATAIHNYITSTLASDPNHLFVVNGDFNGYPYENALQSLTSDGSLNNLYGKLPAAEQYSYFFDGYYQAFDNILVSPTLYANTSFDVVHYNAGYQDGQSITDHDQVVATIGFAQPNAAPTAIAIGNSAVAENAAAGALVGMLTGTDPNGDTLSYSLTDNAGGRFVVDPQTGNVTTTAPLDHEATPTLSITARVTDPSGLSHDQQFTIAVTDVNEAPTALTLSSGTVAENAPAGTVIGTLAGTDPDAGDTLRYSLADNGGGRFAVDAATGQVTTTQPLDYETLHSVSITGRVTDQGGLTLDKAFVVAVTDVNEAPTALTLSSGTVAGNAPAGTVIGTLAGTDPDAGDTLRYSLADNGGGRFAVDAATGQVTTTQPLDHETLHSVSITGRVTDQGGLTLDKAFVVAVTDVNEAPTALALSSGTVAENAPAGTVIGTLAGTDPDAGDTLRYSLADNGGGRFAVDAATGQVTTTQPLDYETLHSVSITGRVTDQGGLTLDKAFVVAVTNVNEAPTAPTLTGASVAENAPAGTVVGTAAATDPDGDALRYSLVSNAGVLFAIDAVTGQLTTTAPFDYEAAASHPITIRATDPSGLSADSAVTIAVRDVNEAPTRVTISNAQVTENAPGGTVIGTLSGNDPDANDTVGFALATNDSRFHIEGSQLVVSSGANIDFETQQSIALAVTATDHAGLAVTSTLTLAVQDVAETFAGTSGNDVINGDGGNNTISGGAGDDTINGGGGNDIIDGGDGNDIINGGPGADRLTLGAGADTVRSLLSELLGDTITDFTAQDRIVVQNSDIHRGDFTVSGTGSSTAIVFAGGQVALSAGLAGGDLMVAHSGTDSILTFDAYLASLSDGKQVAASSINGIINQPYLTGDTSTSFVVKVEATSGAAYSNSLGVYEIDTATGAISDVRIVAANVKNTGAIAVANVDVGHQLGFFIVQDGANKLSSAVQSSTSLSLVNQDGHLALADHGTLVAGATTFFSTSAGANVDGMTHVLSGVAADGSGDLRIGFEDLVRSGSGSDDDFQDVVLTVEATPMSHPTTAVHVPEMVPTPVLH